MHQYPLPGYYPIEPPNSTFVFLEILGELVHCLCFLTPIDRTRPVVLHLPDEGLVQIVPAGCSERFPIRTLGTADWVLGVLATSGHAYQ